MAAQNVAMTFNCTDVSCFNVMCVSCLSACIDDFVAVVVAVVVEDWNL